MKSLIVKVPSEIRYSVKLPKDPYILFYLAAPSGPIRNQSPIHFSVDIKKEEQIENVFSRLIYRNAAIVKKHVTPHNIFFVEDFGRWYENEIDLVKYQEQEVEIILKTSGPNGAIAIWGDPIILQRRKKEQKNVVLISIDTLRADHLSSYGYKNFTSPQIDHLGKNGVLFKNAISCPLANTAEFSLYSFM